VGRKSFSLLNNSLPLSPSGEAQVRPPQGGGVHGDGGNE
jgi:hypothetical protein